MAACRKRLLTERRMAGISRGTRPMQGSENGPSFWLFKQSVKREDYVQGFRLGIRDRGLEGLKRLLSVDLHHAFLDTLRPCAAQGSCP